MYFRKFLFIKWICHKWSRIASISCCNSKIITSLKSTFWIIIRFSKNTVYLTGVVDRLDTWQDGGVTYVRVVDYKTGAKKFHRNDVEIGINIQLLLYLFSVLRCPPGDFRERLTGKEDGEIRAAGAIYLSARPGETDANTLLSREDAFRLAEENADRSGILTDDERVLRAMEVDLEGKYIPYKTNVKDKRSNADLSPALTTQFLNGDFPNKAVPKTVNE